MNFLFYYVCVMKNVSVTLPEDVALWLRVTVAVRKQHIILDVTPRTQSTASQSLRHSAHGEEPAIARFKCKPVVTRRALALCGWPEQLDREIKEREQTEKLLSAEYPELFGS